MSAALEKVRDNLLERPVKALCCDTGHCWLCLVAGTFRKFSCRGSLATSNHMATALGRNCATLQYREEAGETPSTRTSGLHCTKANFGFYCAGKKKSTKEKRELRKAKKRDPADLSVAAARKPTPEELAAAGARLGPRAQVCCSQCLS